LFLCGRLFVAALCRAHRADSKPVALKLSPFQVNPAEHPSAYQPDCMIDPLSPATYLNQSVPGRLEL